jgi:hypothetical protein
VLAVTAAEAAAYDKHQRMHFSLSWMAADAARTSGRKVLETIRLARDSAIRKGKPHIGTCLCNGVIWKSIRMKAILCNHVREGTAHDCLGHAGGLVAEDR